MALDLVIVARFGSELHASVMQGLLESKGITVFSLKADADVPGAFWHSLQVPADQADLAFDIVNKEPEGSEDDACLACGAQLEESSESCSTCGWTFSNAEEWVKYENGPVPSGLLPLAFSPPASRRFGLPLSVVDAYLTWCDQEGLRIIGWQLWARATPVPVILETVVCADPAELRKFVASLRTPEASSHVVSVDVAEPDQNADDA